MFKSGIKLSLIILLPALGIIDASATPDSSTLEKGKYLVQIGGCNDCHTPGYGMSGGTLPEATWLVGDTLGYNGPWGTTYPANLRILISGLSEDQWVAYARQMKTNPPMPWYNLNIMKDEDLRSIYQYIHHLGASGEAVPAYLPPGQEPPAPYATFPSAPATD